MDGILRTNPFRWTEADVTKALRELVRLKERVQEPGTNLRSLLADLEKLRDRLGSALPQKRFLERVLSEVNDLISYIQSLLKGEFTVSEMLSPEELERLKGLLLPTTIAKLEKEMEGLPPERSAAALSKILRKIPSTIRDEVIEHFNKKLAPRKFAYFSWYTDPVASKEKPQDSETIHSELKDVKVGIHFVTVKGQNVPFEDFRRELKKALADLRMRADAIVSIGKSVPHHLRVVENDILRLLSLLGQATARERERRIDESTKVPPKTFKYFSWYLPTVPAGIESRNDSERIISELKQIEVRPGYVLVKGQRVRRPDLLHELREAFDAIKERIRLSSEYRKVVPSHLYDVKDALLEVITQLTKGPDYLRARESLLAHLETRLSEILEKAKQMRKEDLVYELHRLLREYGQNLPGVRIKLRKAIEELRKSASLSKQADLSDEQIVDLLEKHDLPDIVEDVLLNSIQDPEAAYRAYHIRPDPKLKEKFLSYPSIAAKYVASYGELTDQEKEIVLSGAEKAPYGVDELFLAGEDTVWTDEASRRRLLTLIAKFPELAENVLRKAHTLTDPEKSLFLKE